MAQYDATNPLIVQSDGSVLVEVASPRYTAVRDQLARFAELEKAPEHIHTYRITPLSLWNAAASGMVSQGVVATLAEFGKFDLPENVRRDVVEQMGRYGRLKIVKEGERLLLVGDDDALLTQIQHHKQAAGLITGRPGLLALEVAGGMRGALKQVLVKIGYPAEDLAGYVPGEFFDIDLRIPMTASERAFGLRDYQRDAAELFYAGGAEKGGSGVIVLPCGAGKTVVGMAVMATVRAHTLILCPSTVAVRQWIGEIIDKTTIPPEAVGEYTGLRKQLRPITVTTYQTVTFRARGSGEAPHLGIFQERDWGLIIYDEVHLLPAPVFRITAELQARRRLGLTATLVREDGREDDVFSLIGPKRFDLPWKDLEAQGWIAKATCTEVRLPMPLDQRLEYAVAAQRHKPALAAQNPAKIEAIETLLARHADDIVLIIGQYLEQLSAIAERFGLPLVTGDTPVKQREALFAALRQGEIRRLVVSKVANFSIDLPEANVAIQVSGAFGSRQEEAQRLGRILRPKADLGMAHFYALVTRETVDEAFAAARQRFLTEQGYRYQIIYGDELADSRREVA